MDGCRALLEEWGIRISMVLLLDNAAALAITDHGASWRTRYFDVRAARIREEVGKSRLALGHEPTSTMIADALTKLASEQVMLLLRRSMASDFPPAVLDPISSVGMADTVLCG